MQKKKINPKYKPGKLFVEGYNYNDWNKNVELTDKEESVDLSDVLPLSNDGEDVREWKVIKVSTPNKLLTIPILLAQIKAKSNSYKLKN